ncbi:MAG: CBS domain-containing protein [Bacteroidales bacterium]|jgi:CBS domain-containing protein|nr:CBS domain-containing protein [Bacteroidales bacterium]
MLARDLISEVISPLQPSDTGAKGLHRMEAFRISHLPVVNHGDLLGLVSDVDIFDRNRADMPVGEYPLSIFDPFVHEHQHLYEVIELVSRLSLTAVPVLTEKHKYLGVITVQQLIQALGDMAAVNMPGGIIVLELNSNDYSLAQIARIVEDNDAKILSSYTTLTADSLKMEVTLKINQVDLTSIIQSFLRYDYTIKASFQGSNRNEDILRNNYDQFMMYLNV